MDNKDLNKDLAVLQVELKSLHIMVSKVLQRLEKDMEEVDKRVHSLEDKDLIRSTKEKFNLYAIIKYIGAVSASVVAVVALLNIFKS